MAIVSPKNCRLVLVSYRGCQECSRTVVHLQHGDDRHPYQPWSCIKVVTWVQLVISFVRANLTVRSPGNEIINEFLISDSVNVPRARSRSAKMSNMIGTRPRDVAALLIMNTADSHESNVNPLDCFFTVHRWFANNL